MLYDFKYFSILRTILDFQIPRECIKISSLFVCSANISSKKCNKIKREKQYGKTARRFRVTSVKVRGFRSEIWNTRSVRVSRRFSGREVGESLAKARTAANSSREWNEWPFPEIFLCTGAGTRQRGRTIELT